MPTLTARGYALLGLAVATYFGARLVGTRELYFLAVSFIALIAVSWVSLLASRRRVRIDRTIVPERPVAGDAPRIVLKAENRGALPSPRIAVEQRTRGMSDQEMRVELGSLSPRSKDTFRDVLGRVHRGLFLLPPATAVFEDALGLASVRTPVGAELPMTVYPRMASLGSCAFLAGAGPRREWTGYGTMIPGATEFRGVRPHQAGEPLNRIDWKSTAKTGVMMLREMEEPGGNELTVVLDGTKSRVVGRVPETNFEMAVEAAAAIADFALRAGRGVDLLLHERTDRKVRLGLEGNGHQQLLETLASTSPVAESHLSSLLRGLRSSTSQLLAAYGVVVVAISLDETTARALRDLREKGVKVSLVYVDPLSFVREETGDQPRAEDRSLLLGLEHTRVTSLTIRRGDDLSVALAAMTGDSLARMGARG